MKNIKRRECRCGCGKITKPGNKYILGHYWKGTGKTKIRRRCKCGCGEITNYGKKYVHGHNRKNMKHTVKTRKKISLAQVGIKKSKGSILKRSISHIKYNPDDPYCDIWRDREYKKDLRKDYCENVNCRGNCKRLNNHHIDLNKKNCHPKNIMTLCVSCHVSLHGKLQDGKKIIVNPKDFLIINRSDHVTYINKKTRKKVVNIKKVSND